MRKYRVVSPSREMKQKDNLRVSDPPKMNLIEDSSSCEQIMPGKKKKKKSFADEIFEGLGMTE